MNEQKIIRILLLEDNPDDVFLLQQALLRIPSPRFEIIHVERLKDALRNLPQNTIDVIVTDLKVPDGMGVEIVHQLSRQTHETPIVVLTGFADDVLVPQLLQAGASECLVKTGDYSKVVGAVLRVFEEHHKGNAMPR